MVVDPDVAAGVAQETKAQDIEKLYEVLEKARSPTGLLTVQIGKMECGQFVGKIKPVTWQNATKNGRSPGSVSC